MSHNEFTSAVEMTEDFDEEEQMDQFEQIYNEAPYVLDLEFDTRVSKGVEEFVATLYYSVPDDMEEWEVREEIHEVHKRIING
jgi:2-oxo-4-hydroxy-4-carboxy--5-ureidoimidazoline (OHCU) decarboxylase